eukprot:9006245-Prorocentrum_lima.AAC.1
MNSQRGRTLQRSSPAFHVIYSRSPSRSMGRATSLSGPTSEPDRHGRPMGERHEPEARTERAGSVPVGGAAH